jgi:hypothetical protein
MLWALFESGFYPANFFSEVYFNPAWISEEPSVISFSTGTRFGLSELREHRLIFQSRHYSIGLYSLGSELYRENDLNGSLGFKVYGRITVGFSIHFLNSFIRDINNRFNYCLKAGSAVSIGPLFLSGWINNINQARFSTVDRLPTTYSLRADYALEKNIIFGFAIRAASGQLPFYNTGIRTRLFRPVEIELAINTDPVLIEFAACFYVGRLNFKYHGNDHPDLGFSHRIEAGLQL